MVQKINPHPAPGCNKSPPYYVFSKIAILGGVPSIFSEVLVWSSKKRRYEFSKLNMAIEIKYNIISTLAIGDETTITNRARRINTAHSAAAPP